MEGVPNKSEQELIAELRSLVLKRGEEEDPVLFFKKQTDLRDRLRQTYSEAEIRNTRLFHMLIGSGPLEDFPNLDLPGGEIERFIREEL